MVAFRVGSRAQSNSRLLRYWRNHSKGAPIYTSGLATDPALIMKQKALLGAEICASDEGLSIRGIFAAGLRSYTPRYVEITSAEGYISGDGVWLSNALTATPLRDPIRHSAVI